MSGELEYEDIPDATKEKLFHSKNYERRSDLKDILITGFYYDPTDINNDGRVNIKDIQICIKAIVAPGSFTTPDQLDQLAKCQAVAPPETVVNIKDIQAIIRKIINPN